MPAGGEWSTCLQLTPIVDGEEVTPRYLCGRPVERSTPAARLEAWRRNLPDDHIDHEAFSALLDRSTEDLAALRLFDPEHPDRTVVAAGAPWFMTLFGRDSSSRRGWRCWSTPTSRSAHCRRSRDTRAKT